MKVFLGGTCNNSTWRNYFMDHLTMDYFDPVVEDWTEECMAEEIKQRETCDYCLYVITPMMTGVYAIAEAVDDSNKRPEKTIFCYVQADDGHVFSVKQMKSLDQVGKMISRNGGISFHSLENVLNFLNLSNLT